MLYSPHEAQLRFHSSKARFRVFCAGRQAGKSTACLNEISFRAWSHPGGCFWFISPTYAQAKEQFRRLKGALPYDAISETNETELRVNFINASVIHFKSGEVRDSLRGSTLSGAIIDEVRDHHPDTWPMLIRPMLTTTRGWAVFASSPNSFDHFFDMAKLAETDGDWETIRVPSTSNPLFTTEEAAAARRSMTELQYKQEILAEFVNLRAGKVYYAFTDANKRTDSPHVPSRPWSPYHSLILGPDFNVSPMCWNIGQYTYNSWWWFDEIRLMDSNTPEATEQLVNKILIMKAQGFSPPDHDLIICGDASGNSRSTKSNESDYEIIKARLKAAGIRYRNITPKANPSIKDRVNAVNALCRAADGSVRLYVNPTSCKWLIHDLERVTWKEGADFILDPGKDKMLTHSSDGIGYPIAELSPVKAPGQAGKIKVIPRSF